VCDWDTWTYNRLFELIAVLMTYVLSVKCQDIVDPTLTVKNAKTSITRQ
jgi:hypothetical protein